MGTADLQDAPASATEPRLIFRTIHGSRLYGLANESSDEDWYYVWEGKSPRLTQHVRNGVDEVHGSIEGFMQRATTGSHQSLEALFSTKKEWGEGMEQKYRYIESFRVTGGDVFAKYERTIRKFCYGDFKRRRHAVRLYLNLAALRNVGYFNPTLQEGVAFILTYLAETFEGDTLAEKLGVK